MDEFELIAKKSVEETQCECIAIGVFEDALSGNALEVASSMTGGRLKKLVERGEYRGKEFETVTFYTDLKQEKAIVIGLGKEKNFSAEIARKLGAMAWRGAKSFKAKKLAFSILNINLGNVPKESFSQAFSEGFFLAAYRFDKYKTKKQEDGVELKQLAIISDSIEEIGKGLVRGKTIAALQNNARDWINTPASDMPPSKFAEIAKEFGKKYNLKITVFEKEEIERMGMGGVIAVGKGSIQPPKFIVVKYQGLKDGSAAPIVLVGKGVCFDSGGISLKPSEAMETMKGDMAGACAVLATLCAASALKLEINAVGLMPMVENMPDGNAQKPGDIVTHFNKKTSEILNTDAEGRVILADALAYGATLNPKAIIDIATLTGACRIALGNEAIALLGTSAELIEKIKSAGNETFERVWELPLWKEYDEYIKSDVADIKNIGRKGQAGTITGAAYLKHFVSDIPWAHLDIAGVDWNDSDAFYKIKGAEGAGVRLLTRALEKLAEKKK